ncbi:hypothetical protein FDUTEX481_03437 [Tolypothrix sp. PCC 7601]|nr:hypothetical protein FDUTEX481_03437 [Tolypothrix sp. PCC 7601]
MGDSPPNPRLGDGCVLQTPSKINTTRLTFSPKPILGKRLKVKG